MRFSTALVRLLPTDPGYAPFGWHRLRGLNAMPFGIIGLLGLLWMTEGIAMSFYAGGPPSLFETARAPIGVLIGFTPMLVLLTIAVNVQTSRPGVRAAAMAAAMLVGATVQAASWQALACLSELEFSHPECDAFNPALDKGATFIRVTVWGTLIAALLYLARRQREAARALHETHLQRLNAQRQESEARLRSLQAQIEPHFLFNTLAHIDRLHQVDRDKGRSMLRSLIDYLRSALPQMREPDSTLGRELALVRAYANVQQIRMGDRLRVEIDVPPALLDARLPPMMVLTLAENAVKHGLGPKREGGTLKILARRSQGRLEIEVRDDGVGLQLGAGGGRGLANTRARLATHFGREGGFEIGNNEEGGVSASLSLPLVAARPQASAP